MSYVYDRKGPVRVLVLLGLLSLSLFLTGVCGAFLVWRSHNAYRGIVERELPMLAMLRDISRQGAITRRAVNAYAVDNDPVFRAERKAIYDGALRLNDANFTELRHVIGDDGLSLFINLEDSRVVYIGKSGDLLKKWGNAGVIAARTDLDDLEECYAVYLKCQDFLADYAEKQAAEKSTKITQEGRLLYGFFIIVALWPVLISAAFFVYAISTTFYALIRSQR
jgi:hypothetical protein